MSLRVWLPLTGTLENKGISAVTATTFETPTYVTGKIGSCYLRANSNSQLTNGINLNSNLMDILGTQASIAVWVKPLGTHTHYNGTIASSGNWNAKKWAFGVSQDNSKVDVLCGSYNTYITCAVPVNEWTHLVSTFDNGTCKLYKNGEYVGQLTGQKAFETDATNACIARETYASGYFGFNGCVNDVRIYDHCLSAAEVHEISLGLVLHYKLDQLYLKSGTNLVTDVTKGGLTTKLTDGRLGVITSGTNADTYFTINLSESITNGTTYHFSCDASGITEGRYWNFPLGALGNSSLPCKIYNGHNEYVFTANDISWGSNRLFMDDIERSDWSNPATFYNFVLTKNATYEVKDSSGYGHNGTVAGDVSLINTTPRYSSAAHFQPSSGIFNNINITFDTFTISFWAKHTAKGKMLMGSNGSLTNKNTSWYWYGDKSFKYASGEYYYTYNAGSEDALLGTWTHFVATYNGSVITVYRNGVKEGTKAASGSMLMSYVSVGNGYTSTSYWAEGYVSDFRIYVTALSDDDIKQLYNTAAKIDNLGGLHTFELNENGSNKLTKNGIFKDYMVEPFMTLADGSKWQLLLYHQVNNGTNLFTSSNAGFNNGFGLYSRLNYIDNFTYDSKYEFYVILDGAVYRWTQTNAPLTTTSVTGFTAITGSPGSGICKCNGNTLLAKTGTTSNWWNACGCWTIYNGGIPGFGSSVICKQHLILYARILEPKFKIANLSIYANNLIER